MVSIVAQVQSCVEFACSSYICVGFGSLYIKNKCAQEEKTQEGSLCLNRCDYLGILRPYSSENRKLSLLIGNLFSL